MSDMNSSLSYTADCWTERVVNLIYRFVCPQRKHITPPPWAQQVNASYSLWRWYINITTSILDIIRRHVFYLKHEVLGTKFCLCLQVGPTENPSLSSDTSNNTNLVVFCELFRMISQGTVSHYQRHSETEHWKPASEQLSPVGIRSRNLLNTSKARPVVAHVDLTMLLQVTEYIGCQITSWNRSGGRRGC
jgi:hypothetical protein